MNASETKVNGPMRQQLRDDGYVTVPRLLRPGHIDRLVGEIESVQRNPAERRGGNMRNAFDRLPFTQALLRLPALQTLVSGLLGPDSFAVRAILFDKTPDTNWKVAWHQDTAVPLAERKEAEGFGPTSTKAGVAHTRAPAKLLERMLTVRLHLDPCGHDNGPLRVVPGSHRHGRLDDRDIQRIRSESPLTTITAQAGDALVMRPLLLHASSAATSPRHRRVLHLEFAAEDLPPPLRWRARHPLHPTG